MIIFMKNFQVIHFTRNKLNFSSFIFLSYVCGFASDSVPLAHHPRMTISLLRWQLISRYHPTFNGRNGWLKCDAGEAGEDFQECLN